MTLTNANIDDLITARARLTGRSDEYIDRAATQAIDNVLSEVPPGTRNDVDLLLGRQLDPLVASRAAVTRHQAALAAVDVEALLAQHNAEVDERKARLRAWGGDRWVDHALPSDMHNPSGYGMEANG